MKWHLLVAVLVNAVISTLGNENVIDTLYRWKQIDFAFLDPQHRQEAIDNNDFIQANVVPLGVERWKNRVFVSTPAWKRGVPVTLSVLPVPLASQGESEITPDEDNESPLLVPYPNWDWHNAANCTGFTSVFRMNIDHCGTMWVLDSGQVEGFETARQVCPPTLYAIDLETDNVLARYPIPDKFVLQDSLISNLVVDSRDPHCRDLHIYIADARRYGLIVFRESDAAFWRFKHYTFYPEPLLSNYTLHGVNYQSSDGIFGMSLEKFSGGDRALYYHSMSGSLAFVVNTSVLRNPERVNSSVNEFKLLGESRGADGQLTAAAVDRNGVMFFNLVSRDAIGCWDTRRPYINDNLGIVEINNESLVYPNDLRLDHEIPQYGWIISNRLPMYQFNLLKPDEYNFRIMYFDTSKAVENNVLCQPITA